MKLVLSTSDNEFIKSISFDKFESNQNFISDLSPIKTPSEASLITANERITSSELAKLKLNLKKLNINFSNIYSKNRETVLSGKSLKINSILFKSKDNTNESFKDTLSKNRYSTQRDN
tara:strand:- start:49 stop:402 length:354 start_codon:yes stop_codon:yes gene_type:complete